MNDENVWAAETHDFDDFQTTYSEAHSFDTQNPKPDLDAGIDDLWNSHVKKEETVVAFSGSEHGFETTSNHVSPRLAIAISDSEISTIYTELDSWLNEHIPIASILVDADEPDAPEGSLSIESTREVWARLTEVKLRVLKFRGSNVEREVLAILSSWRAKAKDQPSWNQQQPKAMKKNRESIGPVLFGWDRTDIPKWDDQNEKKRLSRLSQMTSTSLDGGDDAFGDFESAPEQISEALSHTAKAEALESHGSPPLAVGEWAANLLDSGISALPIPNSTPSMIGTPVLQNTSSDLLADGASYIKPHVGQHDTAQGNLRKQNGMEGSVNHATNPSQSAAAEAWDFSIFEKQLQQPTVSQSTTSAKLKQQRSESLTPKERQDRENVQRIVSLLPNIEYLLL